MNNLVLSPKYKAFLRCNAPVEFLEGTTAAGKTTVAIFKFILKCAESPKKIHILSGLDLGTIEKNIINKDLGILDDFGTLTEYNAKGKGKYSLPHIVLHTNGGDKIIYVLGYDNKARWKKALGGQYGCLYIDEINIADMEYVRESSMRCDYLIATLNPDDPSLPIYKEYINCSRPLPEWQSETPIEIQQMLSEEPKSGWVHWFFSFEHNYGLSKEKIEQIKMNVPKGTKLYKNKILGLRGRATGLVFNLEDKNIITFEKAKNLKFERFSAALDTSYSNSTPDAMAFIFIGITANQKCIVLDELVYNNANLKVLISPSDIPKIFIDFLEDNRIRWGFARDVYIDSADSATITECCKYKRLSGCIYNFIPAFKQTKIIDRIHLQSAWLAAGEFLVLNTCENYISEMNIYSWQENKYAPEDGHDHCINACQYSWLPYKNMIGSVKIET